MPRYSLATLNHSPLHDLPTQWEAHLDATAAAGFDAIAPDIFWLRALVAEGVSLETIAAALSDRGLACMEIAGIAIGGREETEIELAEQLRYAEALGAEFVNARVVAEVDTDVVTIARRCASEFADVGTRLALEFSRGTKLNSVSDARSFAEAIEIEGVGVTLDTWHFFLRPEGVEWEALEALPASVCANVQLSDGVTYEEGAFGVATMDRRRLPGEGEFDLAGCASRLAARGLDLPVVVEVLNAEERAKPLDVFAQRAMAATRAAWQVSRTSS